ncbi:MFS transporter [Povalibacter sp.]|uniref:MFS transporter n=1 Tax=Povalibacter sp. TaxID=1962978 RepID=UPI002F3E37CF
MNVEASSRTAALPASSMAPLRHKTFAVLWLATVLGNTGTFIRDVASGWLMTDLSASPAAIAMIQVAGTLPIFLFAIPAGVLADILDRRKYLILIQLLLGCVSGTLMMLSLTGLLTVSTLIALTFVGGIGAALMSPTWQSIVPDLVPRGELRSAVALNSLGVNISRSIGPATGGLVLATFGAAATYCLDVLSYVVVIAVLVWWRAPARKVTELSETFVGGFRAGIRYARANRELHRMMFRALMYFGFASCVWALLPLITRELLNGSAGFYGVLLGAVGLGAILGAFVLPRLRSRFDNDKILLLAALLTAAMMAGIALAPPRVLSFMCLVLLGAAWIAALTTLNATTQSILPNWVRGRGLAVYLTVFNGALAAGSLVWGLVAQQLGLTLTLLLSAGGLTITALWVLRYRLPSMDSDLLPSNHWPEPLVSSSSAHERGSVMVLVHYRIRTEDRSAFLDLLGRLSAERRRDGAHAWGVTEDAADPAHIVEWFLIASWTEHLRQHARVTRADADLQEQLRAYHTLSDPPVVEHLLGLTVGSQPH